MKKYLLIGIGVIINFFLLVISIAFYAENEAGDVADGTTDVPVILFLIGCYLVPWYLLNRHKLSKGMNIVTVGLFSWSFLFMWTLLSITEGYFTSFLNFVSFFGSFLLPFAIYHWIRWKEKDMKNTAPSVQKEPVASYEQPVEKETAPLDTLTDLVASIEDPEVSEKGREILVLLRDIETNKETLDTEETHVLNRLMKTDLTQLFQAYLMLNEQKQEAIEADILKNLDIIARYLHSVLDGVSNEYLKEIQTSMHLIEKRYKQ